MHLHIKQCKHCQRFAFRIQGAQEWHQWMRPGKMSDLLMENKVLSTTEETCSECHMMLTTRTAQTIGSVT